MTEEEISCKNPHGDKEYSSNSHSCDNLNEGGFEFLGFAVLAAKKKKNRLFSCGVFRGLRIFRFSAFGFRFSSKTLSGLRIRYAMWFSVFPVWVPVSLRSEQQFCASTDLE